MGYDINGKMDFMGILRAGEGEGNLEVVEDMKENQKKSSSRIG